MVIETAVVSLRGGLYSKKRIRFSTLVKKEPKAGSKTVARGRMESRLACPEASFRRGKEMKSWGEFRSGKKRNFRNF